MATDIRTKIAALLAKAESTDNVFEAESFMDKVNELLETHQIEMHEIRASMGAQKDSDPLGKEKGTTNLYASIKWARDVAGALAKYYGCRFVYWKRGNHFTYEIIGRESARTTFELMLPFVISQVKQQAKRMHMIHGVNTLAVWEREVGQALYVRIWNMIPKAEAHRADLGSKALIPVDDVQAFMDATYGDLKKSRQLKISYTLEAQEAAKRVSINVQATGRGKVKLLEK